MLLYLFSYLSSRIFHFVTRDYFRYRDESSEESDSEDDEGERNDFVSGGIYSPNTQMTQDVEQGLKLAIAIGVKKYSMLGDDIIQLNALDIADWIFLFSFL